MPVTILFSLLLPLAASAGPFRARKDEPDTCPVPPLSAPESTQLKAEQALKVGLVGFGNGGIENGIDRVVQYDNAMFGSDDAYRAWIEHLMCKRVQDGLITREFYTAWLKHQYGMDAPAPTSIPASSLSSSNPPSAVASLSGAYTVASTLRLSSCETQPATSTYHWLVSTIGGVVTVRVEGTTAFSQLSGKYDGQTLVLVGASDEPVQVGELPKTYMNKQSAFRLVRQSDGSFLGERVASSVSEPRLKSDGSAFEADLCLQTFDVKVTPQ